MWAQAVDFIDQAERMHRQFFRLAASATTEPALWQPPVDVFEDEEQVVVVVALPGVAAEDIELATEPGALRVRARRALPFARERLRLRQLEIPYGYFERHVELPQAPLELTAHELTHGCLVVRLARIRPASR
jgi:HSP20 family molecular chaperone IbpA